MLIPSLNHQKIIVDNLHGASLSFAIAEYFTLHQNPLLVIAQDNLSANQLAAELSFFLNQQNILLFPDWETLPYDQFSPHQDIISERLTVLNRLYMAEPLIVIVSVSTLMIKLCPPTFVKQHSLILKEGQKIILNDFRSLLQEAGYFSVHKVMEHGEYAIRGAIMDVYPMGSLHPLRIELFDDEIDNIRLFNPETQRTIQKIKDFTILPAREFPLDEASITLFRRQFREIFSGNPSLCPIYNSITKQQFPSGIEYYLPLFYETTASLFDYLPPQTDYLLVDDVAHNAEQFWQEIKTRYEQRNYDVTRPVLPPERCFIEPTHILTRVNQARNIRLFHAECLKIKGVQHADVTPGARLPIQKQSNHPLAAFETYMQENPKNRCVLMVESAGRREVMLDFLRQSNMHATQLTTWQDALTQHNTLSIIISPLLMGCEINYLSLSLIAEAQLFGDETTPQRRSIQKSVDPDLIIRNLAELRIHSPVVHLQFGVGRYQGLILIEHAGLMNEFLMLTYANDDKIYVPVTSLHLISRYTGLDADSAPLHKLGTDQWQKEKKKAAEKIHDVAIELLDVYAKREATPGVIYHIDKEDYQRFANGFAFTETPDQAQAIEQIILDLQSTRPMDRLICGDVGFGKTEVAMRAAFIAIQNNKQVCILTPTTLLAGQHFETFKDRFADFPVRIELLSRFRSLKDCEQVIASLKSGHTDIVIGTHKLFSKNIDFKNLGLLIIDEEHRFGVKQKEYIKALRTHVDILSMTATPIPRTLNMAMSGIRDISLITTPPAKRLAIKTFWMERQDSVIKEAILREILRGGQVFFLHNNVQTIEKTALELQNLIPEATIAVAHGQMRERQLEKIMTDFYHHRFNVLMCTTIIETGIDIPTANTIIMDRADTFGLAQLHQLRGRVGRSHHQAYAYLLTPNKKILTKDATKRLDAIVSLEDLGAGFILATHDMEIRGAGELLGDDQSGNMQAIGFSLFMEMLDKAVSDLKAGKTPELALPMHQGPEIDLRMCALLPENYISDVHTRLITYKRLANAKSTDELKELQVEMIDRFGLLPQPAKNVIRLNELKLLAASMGLTKIHASKEQAVIEFGDAPLIDAGKLIMLIQTHSTRYQLKGQQQLKMALEHPEDDARIEAITKLLIELRVTV